MDNLGIVLVAPYSGGDLRLSNRRERKGGGGGGGKEVCCYGGNSLEGLVLWCQGYLYEVFIFFKFCSFTGNT